MRSEPHRFLPRLVSALAAPTFTAALGWALTSLLAGTQAAGQEVMRLSSDDSLMIRELGAVAEMTDEGLRVAMAMPGEARPEVYRGVDIRKGDLILMINGQRIRDLATAREVVEGAEPGTEIALGISRDGRTVIIRFPKADPASLPDRMVYQGPGGGHGVAMESRVMVQGDGGDLTPVMGLGVVLESDGEEPETVKVGMVLPGAQTELLTGDVLRKLGGVAVESAAAVAEAVEDAEAGAMLEIVVTRGDSELTFRQPKSAMQGSVRVRRQ